jgi:hypothetical protein
MMSSTDILSLREVVAVSWHVLVTSIYEEASPPIRSRRSRSTDQNTSRARAKPI